MVRPWVKWALAGSAAAFVAAAAAVVALGWFALEYTRPNVEIGAPMPELRLASFDGAGDVRLDQYRGQVVVLDFWSSG